MEDSLQISPLTKADAPDLWPFFRERLKAVEEEMGDVALPERVYVEWAAGRATLWTIRWRGRLTGAMVITGPEQTGSLKTRLWVWALSVEGIMSPDLQAALNEWLTNAALKTGASSVGMASSREGWGRYLKAWGWKPVQTEYELEVSRGK